MGHFARWLSLREGADEDIIDRLKDARGRDQIVGLLRDAGLDYDEPKSNEPLVCYDGQYGQRWVVDDMDRPWPEQAEAWVRKEVTGGRAGKWIDLPATQRDLAELVGLPGFDWEPEPIDP